MSYSHQFLENAPLDLPVGKVVCVGRNYADHIAELNNAIPDEPLLFIKPNTACVDMCSPVGIPTSSTCHNELEVALLITQPLISGQLYSDTELLDAVGGLGLGLDLTLRDKQSELKSKGHPWERAKSFDASCPLSPFVRFNVDTDLQDLHFELKVNDNVRQSGHTANMMHPCFALIREILSCFSLLPGDVVMTGTPKGVGPLLVGDKLAARLCYQQNELLNIKTQVE
ncbi:fumarylacetoacetate hydrolase family protein [Alteromonas sp. a30]|uniref:fumarylacetoacetate hydrolase family protein n=1 Tax=Alteromonas sp. a30 TaxID=2730917 RepID=UPI00227FD2B9|nr:fumarylacetoacetate hydrolase family protein [Alteromonas sp. a30]MCY7296824.1 fumarylacetoacetate hydrolase family protein [Alteromonas sp. a30]